MPDTAIGNASSAWIATSRWNDTYESEFAQWVQHLGAGRKANKASTLTGCLRKSDVNTLYTDEDRNFSVSADCADLPYILRAYFSYKKRLPFSYTSSISGGRYSSGNKPLGRRSFLHYSSLARLMQAINNNVHSGFFRFFWSTEKTDTYLCEVQRNSIVPGTVYYDANGHVLVVFQVEADGAVWFIDGHPDNSLTVKRFGEAFTRGQCNVGGGFRRWRQQWIDSDGAFVLASNADSRFFDGRKTQCQSSYSAGGQNLNYFQWVRKQLSTGGGTLNPTVEFRKLLGVLHEEALTRVEAIQAAITHGIHRKAHPNSLPENIYGASGEWESYSTPGRDARLKAQTRECFNFVKFSVNAVNQGDHSFDFDGAAGELVRHYKSIWNEVSTGKTVAYENSQSSLMRITLATVLDRLFKLSFDPYHCPELRWGDIGAGACPDNSDKRSWYDREQRLRNAIDPDLRARTTLDWGPATTPDIRIDKLLETLGQTFP